MVEALPKFPFLYGGKMQSYFFKMSSASSNLIFAIYFKLENKKKPQRVRFRRVLNLHSPIFCPPPKKKTLINMYRLLMINEWIVFIDSSSCLVSWGYRIHWQHLCRRKRPLPKECFGYDTKQSDGEVLVRLELWEMWSTPSLPLLPGPLGIGVVSPHMDLIELTCCLCWTEQFEIELFWHLNCIFILKWTASNRTVLTCKLHTYAKLNCFKWNCF